MEEEGSVEDGSSGAASALLETGRHEERSPARAKVMKTGRWDFLFMRKKARECLIGIIRERALAFLIQGQIGFLEYQEKGFSDLENPGLFRWLLAFFGRFLPVREEDENDLDGNPDEQDDPNALGRRGENRELEAEAKQ